MKNKIHKIWSVGLALVLATTLLLSAVPVSAGELSWGTQSPFPSTTGNVLAPSFNVTDLAVSSDGVMYAVNATDNATFKSTSGGTTWSRLSAEFPANLSFIAVAPDDSDVVAVGYGANVSISTNGGSTWGNLGQVKSGSVNLTTMADLAVSNSDGSKNYIGVAGTDSGTAADFWYFDAGASAPSWHSTKGKGGFATVQVNGLAIAFSQNVASDKTMAVVSENTTNTFFQVFSLSTEVWNTPFGSGYPVDIQNDSTSITTATGAAIGLAPDYLGSDDSMRIAFVGLTVSGGTYGGVYRLKDTTDKAITDDKNIKSIDYDGTNLVAGAADSNKVYRSDNALATSPDFSTASSLKRPGGENNVIVAWRGSDVVAGASGKGSAFAVSVDNGASFNDISLIAIADTATGTLGTMVDVEVSADGSVIYMLTRDTEALSLWRYTSSWERVLGVIGGAATYIVRTAPDDPDAVYVALTGAGAKTIYYSQEGGDTKWFTRIAKYDIADMAVESADVAYVVVNGTASISKTTNSGFTWASSEDTGVTGSLNMIRTLGEDKIIVGSNAGYVGWSTDGNDSWSKINTRLNAAGLTQVTASGLSDGDYVYAATDTAAKRVERWEIGQSGTSWKNLEAPLSDARQVYGIALVEGVLYVQTQNATGVTTPVAATLRTIEPTTDEPSSGKWSTMSKAGPGFSKTPQALKVSAGSTKLWSVSSNSSALYVFEDTLGVTGPTLSAPGDGAAISMNPVSGIAFAVPFTWERPSKGLIYDLQVATDSGFNEKLYTATTASSTGSTPGNVAPAGTFMPDTTYYWRVRVNIDGPIKSPWSEVRSFAVGSLPEIGGPPVIIEQPPAPIISVPEAPAITITVPEIVLPSAQAAPEIVIPPAPTAPAPITPAFIWAIIIIGAVLVIAVIVLIVRTRRPV